MKRVLDEQAVKEQLGEDAILVPKARPLQADELELIEIHRTLTQHWRNNATTEAREELLKLGIPTLQRGGSSEFPSDDGDLALQYSRLLEIAEPALFPDELLQAELTHHPSSTEHMVLDQPDGKNSMHKIDEVMEREAKYVDSDDPHADRKKKDHDMDFENTITEHEDNLVGDYDYTFCEEEDAY